MLSIHSGSRRGSTRSSMHRASSQSGGNSIPNNWPWRSHLFRQSPRVVPRCAGTPPKCSPTKASSFVPESQQQCHKSSGHRCRLNVTWRCCLCSKGTAPLQCQSSVSRICCNSNAQRILQTPVPPSSISSSRLTRQQTGSGGTDW